MHLFFADASFLWFDKGIFFCFIAIGRWGHMDVFFELFRKVGTVDKPCLRGDFIDGFFCFNEQLFCFIESYLQKQLKWTGAIFLFQATDDMCRVKSIA